MQPRIGGCTRECVAVATYARLVAAKSGEQRPVLVQQLRAGAIRQQPLEMRNRFGGAAGGSERARKLRPGTGKVRAQLYRPLQGVDPGAVAGLEQRAAEIAMGLSESGLERNHASVPLDCSLERSLSAPGVRQVAD